MVAYATAWLLLGWFCMQKGGVSQLDAILVAVGLLLIHGSAIAVMARAPRGWRRPAQAAYVLLSILSATVLLLYCRFMQSNGAMNGDVVRAIAQSNPGEIAAYLARLASWLDVGVAAAIGTIFVGLAPRQIGSSPHVLRICGLAMAVGIFSLYQGSASLREILEYHLSQYNREMTAFRAMLESRQTIPIRNAITSFNGTVVLIVGESTARRHMSLYGYVRPTTPRLDSMGENILAFSDVISAHSHTVPALMAALTSAGSTRDKEYFSPDSIDIVSLARAAGFEVHWISNQNEYGLWDSPVSMIAKQSDDWRFITTTVGSSFRRTSYDDRLISELRTTLQQSTSSRRLIVMHLFSAHWPYCSNHPKNVHYFTGELGPKFLGAVEEPPDINCYDDSIRYIDSIIEESTRILDDRHEPAALLYFSDHGEAPLLGTGHESFKHSIYQIDVPLLLWTNERYSAEHARLLEAARSNLARPYSTSRLYHSLAHLLQIRHDSVNERDSLFSPSLEDRPRYSLDGKIRYDEWAENNHYLENAAVNLRLASTHWPAIWAHRVNSLGSLNEALPIFGGVEMDVVFMDPVACFHVFHPPAPDRQLTLEEMFQAAASNPRLRIWLDWKNASRDNLPAALTCLDALDRKFSIRNRVLVETGSDAVFPETRTLAQAGYLNSYYLPLREISTCKQHCEQLALELRSTVEQGGYGAISFDWAVRDFVKQYLADWAHERHLQLFSWDIGIDIAKNSNAPSRMDQHFSELNLSALLVTFPSQFRN